VTITAPDSAPGGITARITASSAPSCCALDEVKRTLAAEDRRSPIPTPIRLAPDEPLLAPRRRRLPARITHLAFSVSSATSLTVRDAFGTWVQLRHYDLHQAAPGSFDTTVGVLLSRRTDGIRDWDTSMVAMQGPIDLEPDTLEIWRRVWLSNNPAVGRLDPNQNTD